MRLVEEIGELKNAIDLLREQGNEWHTNYYIADDVVARWIISNKLKMYEEKNHIFLSRERDSFSMIYYFSVDSGSLGLSLQKLMELTDQTLSVDILHKNNSEKDICDALLMAGFTKRIRLYRMRIRKCHPVQGGLLDLCYADTFDVGTIEEMLHNEFDELCEQIPDREEIEEAVKKREILAVREKNILIAICWLERKGGIALVRYWLTRGGYRSCGVGTKLLHKALSLNNDATQVFVWVREDNSKAIEKYKKVGFVKDGLVDDVYCLIR